MNVLVVGGAGYVGGGIVDLLSNKHNVTVYDSLIYENSYRKDVDFIYGDIRDYKKLNPIFKNLTKNFKGKIIFLSTCSVYGAQEGILNEDSSVNPLSEYASSKLVAENYLQDSNAIIFRLGTLFGIGDQFSRIRLDLVVNILTTKSLLENKMSVFGGDQWRPLLHVKDVANAIDNTIEGSVNGIFNLHHKNYKIIELAEKIKEKIPEVTIETTPLPFQDARNYQVSSEKLKTETGFEASIELERGINEVYDLISSNRIKDINDPRYSNQSFLQTFGVS